MFCVSVDCNNAMLRQEMAEGLFRLGLAVLSDVEWRLIRKKIYVFVFSNVWLVEIHQRKVHIQKL